MSLKVDKLDDVIQTIDLNTDLFYQNKINEGYSCLDKTLGKISEAIEEIIKYQASSGQDIQGDKIIKILTEALKALEKKDSLLLADILQYDLKELLVEIRNELK